MKLSAFDKDKLDELTREQVSEIVFGSCGDDGVSCDAALLLGCNPTAMPGRTRAAANLYHAGRAPYIVPSGGVFHDTPLGRMTEAEYMALLLKEYGVPEDAIILENQATTTRENMICGTLQMVHTLKKYGPFRVCIVTSPSHLRRSLALAKLYLPRTVEISGCPGVCPEGQKDTWHLDEQQTEWVWDEVRLLKKYIDFGDIEDIEF